MNGISPDPQQPDTNNPQMPGGTQPGTPQTVRMGSLPKDRRPWVSWILLGVTVLCFLLQMLSENLLGRDILVLYGAKINELIYQGQFWRLITPMLLHGSVLHIAFNMYALYAIGPALELHYGRVRFLALYLLGAFAGNVLSMVFTPAPSLGASTAIFGLIAAQAIFIFRNRFLFGKRSGALLGNILFIVLFNLFLGLRPGIDNWGHLGGLLGGSVFAWFSGPVLSIKQEPWGYLVEENRATTSWWNHFFLTTALFGAIALIKIFFFQL